MTTETIELRIQCFDREALHAAALRAYAIGTGRDLGDESALAEARGWLGATPAEADLERCLLECVCNELPLDPIGCEP